MLTYLFINVKDAPWNAVGNDATDDSVAIANAFLSASAASGGAVIYFPPGAYRMDLTGTSYNNSTMKVTAQRNVYVQGDSDESATIYLRSGYDGITFGSGGASSFSFGGVRNVKLAYLVQESGSPSTAAIRLVNASNIKITDWS